MPAPVHRMLKKDILWLAAHTCRKHRVSYLEHWNCYLRDYPDYQERAGYFDIETSNLKASIGFVLSWAIYEPTEDHVDYAVITKDDLNNNLDKRLMEELIETMADYDRLYTYYGTRFDLPFVRTRSVVHGLKFPIYGATMHQDIYYLVRNKFSLHSNRLKVVEETLLGEDIKTRVNPNIWTWAMMGKPDALEYVLDHNIKDVKQLYKVHQLVEDFVTRPNRSI